MKSWWNGFDQKWKFLLAVVTVATGLVAFFEFLERYDLPRLAFRPSIDKQFAGELAKLEKLTLQNAQQLRQGSIQLLQTYKSALEMRESFAQWRLDELQGSEDRFATERRSQYQAVLRQVQREQERVNNRLEELEK